jgi:DNA-binding MurR/RpiR family transcriptional regulator
LTIKTAPAGSTEDDSVSSHIRARLHLLSAAEARVARAVLARYPTAGLETTQRLAASANVSPPTVVRFAAALGFSGYREFQSVLRDEIQDRQAASPLSQSQRGGTGRPGDNRLDRAGDAFTRLTQNSFTGFGDNELERAITMITDPAVQVRAIGGRFSRVLAEYLHLHLSLMRSGSAVVADDWRSRTDFLVDLNPGDLVVAFDYRRYQSDTIDVVQRAHARGARVMLFTDIWLSPIASVAEVVFTSDVEAPSPFDSLTGAMAVLETLISELLPRIGPSAEHRLRLFEQTGGEPPEH